MINRTILCFEEKDQELRISQCLENDTINIECVMTNDDIYNHFFFELNQSDVSTLLEWLIKQKRLMEE